MKDFNNLYGHEIRVDSFGGKSKKSHISLASFLLSISIFNLFHFCDLQIRISCIVCPEKNVADVITHAWLDKRRSFLCWCIFTLFWNNYFRKQNHVLWLFSRGKFKEVFRLPSKMEKQFCKNMTVRLFVRKEGKHAW